MTVSDLRVCVAITAVTVLLFGVITGLQRFGPVVTVAGTVLACVVAFGGLCCLTIAGVI